MRVSLGLTGLVLVVSIFLVIVGLTSGSPGALIPVILCGSPLFFFLFGLSVGRFGAEFKVVKKEVSDLRVNSRRGQVNGTAAPVREHTPLGQ